MRDKSWFGVLKNLTYLTQVGLSMITPILLLLLGAAWLVQHTAVGGWVYAVAIVLGLGAGASAFVSFARHVTRCSSTVKQGEPPVAAKAQQVAPPETIMQNKVPKQ